jgi:hypothetical protein
MAARPPRSLQQKQQRLQSAAKLLPYAPGHRNYQPQWTEQLRAIKAPANKAGWR